jgi:pimeloyl-ACP methyl ester carboxylesterase
MVQIVGLPGGRTASFQVIGTGRPALMFPGGPGFGASYMSGDARLLSDVLCCYLIDPPGSGSSTPPPDPAGYSPDGLSAAPPRPGRSPAPSPDPGLS